MTAFRVGISADFERDGVPTFPTYDISALHDAAGVEVTTLPAESPLRPETIAGLDAVILLGEQLRASSLTDGCRLAHVARVGVGYDTVDVPACTAHDVVLTICPDGVRRPMAVAIVTLLLALAGNLMAKDRIARKGVPGWDERMGYHGTGLIGRTLGSVGIGNIGAEMFRMARPFEMRHIAHDPYAEPAVAAELGVDLVGLDDVFARSDFLTFNCPLTDETRGIGSAAGIAAMKPTAYLINTSRGPVVDRDALYDALAGGRIAGAGLDVFDPEPPLADDPLLTLDNVVLAPHSLGWTDQMFAEFGRLNAEAVLDVAAGRVPGNVVNGDVLDRPGFRARLAAFSGR